MKYYVKLEFENTTASSYSVGYGDFVRKYNTQSYDDAVERCDYMNSISEKPNKSEISLRDYFAGKALQSLISKYKGVADINKEDIATMAYDYADVMLAERSKGNE